MIRTLMQRDATAKRHPAGNTPPLALQLRGPSPSAPLSAFLHVLTLVALLPEGLVACCARSVDYVSDNSWIGVL